MLAVWKIPISPVEVEELVEEVVDFVCLHLVEQVDGFLELPLHEVDASFHE